MSVKCTTCGAPATPGTTVCEYCGQALEFGPGTGPAPSQATGPAPGMVAPGGSAGEQGGYAGEGQTRALAPDGCWYPVAASPVAGDKYLVRFSDGKTATLPKAEVRPPCDANALKPGTRVMGEYEGKYFPGTVIEATQGGWNCQFDDGERATMTADTLCLFNAPQPPVSPGTMVLCQVGDEGQWWPGRVLSGPDREGRQRIRMNAGGDGICSRGQINEPASPELMAQGKRVMGIGDDGYFYPGTVVQSAQGQCEIKFDDGEQAWLMAHEVRFIH